MISQTRQVMNSSFSPATVMGSVKSAPPSPTRSDSSSTAEKVTWGALLSFISTKIILAIMIGRRKWRGKNDKDPDRLDRFVDWLWSWSTYLPRRIYQRLKPTPEANEVTSSITARPISVEVSSEVRTNAPVLASRLPALSFTRPSMWGGVKVENSRIVRY